MDRLHCTGREDRKHQQPAAPGRWGRGSTHGDGSRRPARGGRSRWWPRFLVEGTGAGQGRPALHVLLSRGRICVVLGAQTGMLA